MGNVLIVLHTNISQDVLLKLYLYLMYIFVNPLACCLHFVYTQITYLS